MLVHSPPNQLSEDDRTVILRGEAFESLLGTIAWKEILDFLTEHDEEAVSCVVGNKSSDPEVALHFQRILQQRRYVLEHLQHFVLGSIEQKRRLLKSNNEEEEQWPKV